MLDAPLSLPVHPRTGLTAVGIVGGRPVWPILGAEDDPANPVQPVDDPAPADPAPAGSPEPPASDPPADPAPEVDDKPDVEGKTYSQNYVEKLRKEAANRRDSANQEKAAREAAEAAAAEAATKSTKLEEILSGLQKVLNPDAPKEEPLDPAKLVAQLAKVEETSTAALAEKDATIRALLVENALPSVYSKLQATPGLTTKVLKADGVIETLDPASKTFAKDLESAVAKALEENPSLKAAPVVVKTGTEPTGRAGATDQLTREQLKGMSPEEITKAQRDGRLKSLLGG